MTDALTPTSNRRPREIEFSRAGARRPQDQEAAAYQQQHTTAAAIVQITGPRRRRVRAGHLAGDLQRPSPPVRHRRRSRRQYSGELRYDEDRRPAAAWPSSPATIAARHAAGVLGEPVDRLRARAGARRRAEPKIVDSPARHRHRRSARAVSSRAADGTATAICRVRQSDLRLRNMTATPHAEGLSDRLMPGAVQQQRAA